MLTDNDKDKIRKMFLFEVKSGETRSKIMRVAAFASEGQSPEKAEQTYYSVMYHLSQPENAKELDRMYKATAGWMPDIEEGGEEPDKSKVRRPRGEKVRRVKPE